MAYRLDVVAVRITHERTEVAGVIFRPEPRRVQRLGTELHGSVIERLHLLMVGGAERDMNLTVGTRCLAGAGIGDPERGSALQAVPDGDADIQLPDLTQDGEHRIVKLPRPGVVGAVDTEVIDHGNDLA